MRKPHSRHPRSHAATVATTVVTTTIIAEEEKAAEKTTSATNALYIQKSTKKMYRSRLRKHLPVLPTRTKV